MLHEPLLDKISKMPNSTRLVRDLHKSHVQGTERKPGAMTPAQNNLGKASGAGGEDGSCPAASHCRWVQQPFWGWLSLEGKQHGWEAQKMSYHQIQEW